MIIKKMDKVNKVYTIEVTAGELDHILHRTLCSLEESIGHSPHEVVVASLKEFHEHLKTVYAANAAFLYPRSRIV